MLYYQFWGCLIDCCFNFCSLSSSPRLSWRALNGVATASVVVGSMGRWSRPPPRTTRSCVASCAACRPTCCVYGDAKSSPTPRSCGSSGGVKSPTSPVSFIMSWKVREREWKRWRMRLLCSIRLNYFSIPSVLPAASVDAFWKFRLEACTYIFLLLLLIMSRWII